MYTFIIAIVILVVGYFIYGTYIARIVDVNPQNTTPALTRTDGIDFVPLPTWKVFMIQFLNIAGLGPIFGAIMGAQFGTASYLWIVFGTIFGGAVSGSHATQSPLMARCLKNEKHAKPVFYGAMIAEGIVALIWAATATAFYQDNGTDITQGQVVNFICHNWMGVFGGVLAILGVVFAPITTGDTVLRAVRLIVADTFHIEQKSIRNRMLICIPIFAVCAAFLVFSLGDTKNFAIVWRYFTWSNQVMAAFTFWAITVYLTQRGKNYFVSLIPAIFMSFVTISFILEAPTGAYIPGKGLTPWIAQTIAAVVTITLVAWFCRWMKIRKTGENFGDKAQINTKNIVERERKKQYICTSIYK